MLLMKIGNPPSKRLTLVDITPSKTLSNHIDLDTLALDVYSLLKRSEAR